MTATNVQFLNLDELAPAVSVTVKLDGTDHKMKEMNVEDFAWVQTRLKGLEKKADPGDYLDALCQMVHRSFPTIAEARLKTLELGKLERLLEFTLNIASKGGENALAAVPKDEGKEGDGNPSVAGS